VILATFSEPPKFSPVEPCPPHLVGFKAPFNKQDVPAKCKYPSYHPFAALEGHFEGTINWAKALMPTTGSSKLLASSYEEIMAAPIIKLPGSGSLSKATSKKAKAPRKRLRKPSNEPRLRGRKALVASLTKILGP